MNPVEINDLISSILSKLTGDFDSDLKYLLNEMQKYKNHENGLEITRAIGRVIGDMIPDEQKEKFLQLLDNEQLKDDTLLDQAGFYIYKKEFDKAYYLLNNYLTKFEESKWFVDDELSEYHYFRDQIEKLLYILICKPKKECRDATTNYGEMYRLLGYVLIELGRTEEAKIALEKGMKWNPMNLDTKFEYYETFKMSDKDRYLELSKEAMKIAYLKKDIARIYRNIGFILIEKKNYEAACYTYMLSNMCESNEKNASELYYIQQVSGKDYTCVTPERLLACLNENEIPYRPNEKLMDSLCQIAMVLEDKKVYPDALKAYTLLSDLTDDETIKNKVKELTAIVEKTK